MRFWILFLSALFLTLPVKAQSVEESALTVYVARKTLVDVMQKIAGEIDGLKNSFPQLESWNEAQIFPDRIEYHHRDCDLSITSKSQTNSSELKVGVYLKMKAFGKRAALLKQALLRIIAKHFEEIRDLHRLS